MSRIWRTIPFRDRQLLAATRPAVTCRFREPNDRSVLSEAWPAGLLHALLQPQLHPFRRFEPEQIEGQGELLQCRLRERKA